ncbi:sushi, von Willebrand factor type A, EGF and pentraxin domain-containing protein 1 [Trichonephila clavata]|uniref:Sushi, von Willebrand factor type A, EGF and pentraxin domain-containing protein 1 n=1 Tax=Trichonephila clavata TaxID=2740835 RepID=A0A8X6KMA3_TRICU|nr:sushi, von Willebrand factor type A, EGF and pentraxin domain-containing protein 1 [Trichonephila clavata]
MLIILIISILLGIVDNVSGRACSRSTKEWSTGTTKYTNVEHNGQISVFTSCLRRDFIVDGEDVISCENGLLTGDLPVCKKATNECLTPLPLENGKVIGCFPSRILRFNDTCHFKCNEGFQLAGPDHLTCALSGKMVDGRGVQRFPKCYMNNVTLIETEEIETFDETPPTKESCDPDNGQCSHKCIQELGGIRCECRGGYKLLPDNRTCEDIDECSSKNFGCSYKCINTKGAAHCTCPKGYTLLKNNRKQCVDIDECVYQNFGCSHKCFNTVGGARCRCPTGYKLHTRNKKLCIDINECSVKNFGCSHQCINTLGGAHCICPKGYRLQENKKQCMDVDECADDRLNRCDHDCFNTEGGYNCSCDPGHVTLDKFRCEPCRINSYKSMDDEACVDCPAHSHTESVGKTSRKECICNSGFFGNLAHNIPCLDINECALDNFGCSDICSNTLGSAHCACQPGLELQEDQKTCSDIDECRLKNGGCDGICHNTVGNFTCSCLDGYVASVNDKYSCEDVDECEENNGGCSDKCINFKGGYHCTCPEGYHLPPDSKNCMAVHCPRVYVPHHSTLKCKNGLTTDKTEYKPGEMPENAEFPFGTVCKVKCSKGYELSSDPTIVCRNNGHWNATPSECQVLQCPLLNPPDNGDVYPPSCKEGPMAVKEKCIFTCLPGFRITGQEVITCKNKLEWDFKKTTVCVAETHPYISCPDDIIVELQSNGSTLEITLDSPRTNAKQIHVSPEWVFLDTPTSFPAGETEVTFVGEDDSGNKTVECSMSVFVVDKESPVFYDCPDILHVTGSSTGTAVEWEEPTAFDNVGIASLFKSLEPNRTLTLGVHFVEYIARDLAGNTAQCHFRINITSVDDCRDLEDPENGEANCMDWQNGKICQPSCHLNYTRLEEEPEYFACDDSGEWIPSNFISPCFRT